MKNTKRHDVVRRMLKEGATYDQIARKLFEYGYTERVLTRQAILYYVDKHFGKQNRKNPGYRPEDQDVLSFIQKYIAEVGYPPSFEDIANGLQCSVATARKVCLSLQDSKQISLAPRTPRSIVIL